MKEYQKWMLIALSTLAPLCAAEAQDDFEKFRFGGYGFFPGCFEF